MNQHETGIVEALFSDSSMTRRRLMGTGAGAVLATGIAACGGDANSTTASSTGGGKPKRGGTLKVGLSGGGADDTLDPQTGFSAVDSARQLQLYEGLAYRKPNADVEMALAEEITPGKSLDEWTIRLREGVEFHNGKSVTPDDVIFSLRRIVNPKDPKDGALDFDSLDVNGFRKLDARTLTVKLKRPDANFIDAVSQYWNNIVPVDFDINDPVGTGPFKFKSLTKGQQSTFVRSENYWRTGQPYVDEVVILDFPDKSAQTNALLSGQIHAMDSLPLPQLAVYEKRDDLTVLRSESGGWLPFTMRVDAAPFDDNRVRQAFRLIVDRKQMIEQALVGAGRVANDLFAPYDPGYNSELPQREQDLEQAKSLLKAAGQEGMTVRLTTSGFASGVVEAAQVFARQAAEVGVKVNVKKVDGGTFYGDDFLKWPFAQDYWYTRSFLSQVSQSMLPRSPANETSWRDPRYIKLVTEARETADEGRRNELIREAQAIEHESGGYIIWAFRDQIDGHSNKVRGFEKSRLRPLGNYGFRTVSFV